jgi:hypothetical protein
MLWSERQERGDPLMGWFTELRFAQLIRRMALPELNGHVPDATQFCREA